MPTPFSATKHPVANRGVPPDSFLWEIVDWGRRAPEEIFSTNPFVDIYSSVRSVLGPYQSIPHRRAVMLEVMRVHAGFESSWNWNEGVDTTNAHSVAHPEGQETGIFQVSFDSEYIDDGFLRPFAVASGIDTVGAFISKMKSDHQLALEYYARLVRINVKWAGPIVRHEIDPWLRRDAVEEFQTLLS